MMWLIVGLGNPGERYRSTRHNVGFRCIDAIAARWGIAVNERRAKAVLGRGRRSGHEVVLAKPRTFMNNSGEGVSYLLTRFGARPNNLLIIYDEMELPLGMLRLRPSGSDGGHNGIRSIIAALHGQNFPRLRVGIGHPPPDSDPVAHVLGRFTTEESPLIDESVARAALAVDCLLEEDINAAMNRFNQRPQTE